MLSPEKQEEFKKLWLSGVKVSEISQILGIQPDTIYVYVKVFGLPPRSKRSSSNEKIRRESLEYIRQLWFDGLTAEEIAERFEVSVWTIREYLRAMGLRRRSRTPCVDIPCSEFMKLYDEGHTDEEIAKTYQTSKSCVTKLRRLCGINKRKVIVHKSREKMSRIMELIANILNDKGYVTSVELRKKYNVNINLRLLKILEANVEGIKWFRLKYTSTYRYSVFPRRFINMTIIYLSGSENAVISYLKENTLCRYVNHSILKTLLRMNNAPKELINAL